MMRLIGRIVSSCIQFEPVVGLRVSARWRWCALFHAREAVSATDVRKNDSISQGYVPRKSSIYRGLKSRITFET